MLLPLKVNQTGAYSTQNIQSGISPLLLIGGTLVTRLAFDLNAGQTKLWAYKRVVPDSLDPLPTRTQVIVNVICYSFASLTNGIQEE